MNGIAAEARRRTLACAPADAESAQAQCELETVKLSLRNLMTFPWISSRVTKGALALHGGSFDIRTGVLSYLAEDGSFTAVA